VTDCPLVQPLVDGPVDIVGDIHGEIDALGDLMRHLGYTNEGVHPEGRRLIFVGDLTDRGPNSPAVIRLVTRLLDEGLAQSVLGNHDLNLLLGKHKHGNAWFFGKREALDRSGRLVPQALADEQTREQTLRLFRRLPLVLERPDLRVVHASWNAAAVEQARRFEGEVLELHRQAEQRIDEGLSRLGRGEIAVEELLDTLGMTGIQAEKVFQCRSGDGASLPVSLAESILDDVGRGLARQNGDPVKLLTSGPEQRVPEPFESSGKIRYEGRMPWWNDYTDDAFCVFGHYSRARLPGDRAPDRHFDDARPYAALGNGRTVCIDYSVTRRWWERFNGGPPYRTALAALRWPERWLYFDTGRPVPLV
jgi:Calcineurin-like phosphoesterase